ncbi:hypothetical protein GCM10009077_26600 [Roseibium denhamense]|uniref:Uncharacterized protein n=1 Tax=Roseibium denhamense TaxID=76305 RepID=A0ABY1PK75_9HYPH|nr:hypothetical protein SAMN06265374_4114 [Roseibium denhamense]
MDDSAGEGDQINGKAGWQADPCVSSEQETQKNGPEIRAAIALMKL